MGWSWRLGTIASIGVYVHATFFIIIAWVVFIYWNQGKGFWATLDGVVFVLAIFGCVVLHELGHAPLVLSLRACELCHWLPAPILYRHPGIRLLFLHRYGAIY